MRNFSEISSERFCNEVERRCSQLSENFLRTTVFDNPTLRERFENCVKIKSRNQTMLEIVAICSWFHKDEWIGWMIRDALQEIIKEDEEKYFVLNFYLQSKSQTLIYLLETNRYSSFEFFGLLGQETIVNLIKAKVKFCFKPTSTPNFVQRRRGYKDKGSLKLAHNRRNIGPQTTLHYLLEEAAKARNSTFDLLQGFLE